MAIHLCKNNRIGNAVLHQFVYQSTLFAQAILMVTHTDYNHFGMVPQASQILITGCSELQHKKFERRIDQTDKGNGIVRKDGEEPFPQRKKLLSHSLYRRKGSVFYQLGIDIVVNDILLRRIEMPGKLLTDVDIVGIEFFFTAVHDQLDLSFPLISGLPAFGRGGGATSLRTDHHRNIRSTDSVYRFRLPPLRPKIIETVGLLARHQ